MTIEELLIKVADELYIKIEALEEQIAVIKDNQHKINDINRTNKILIMSKLADLERMMNKLVAIHT
jgi:hypothetical protein